MLPNGRRPGWLTAAVIAMLVCRAMRARWRRVVAVLPRPGRRAQPRQGSDDLTAEDKRRLVAWALRARHDAHHGDGGPFRP